jgi:phage shock protein E
MSAPLFDIFNRGGSDVKPIKPDEVKNRLALNKNTVLLDVRSPEEHRDGHIPGSQLLPLHELAFRAKELPADKSTPLIVYCLSGARSRAAATQLVRAGYSEVYDMGGITSWPYEIKRGR